MRPTDLTREAEIQAYDVLEHAPVPALQRIVDLAALCFGAASAEINLITATEQHHVAATHHGTTVVPKEVSFCGRVIERPAEPYVIEDAREDPEFAESPFVTGALGSIAFYAAAKLRAPTGTVLGTLCVFDPERRTPSAEQLAMLEELSGTVVAVLEMRRTQLEMRQVISRVGEERRLLITSNGHLEEFAGQVSHDLKNPLASLRLALEMLADGGPHRAGGDPESAFLLERALSSTERMGRLIEDLMDFATVGGSTEPVAVDLDLTVRHVLDDLASAIGDARVELGPLPAVLGGETQVRAVLQNLVANALKFTRPVARPCIRVAGTTHGRTARITVTDNGPGVPDADRERIFERLARAGNGSVDGHGIGLATCARIVASLGGAIGVSPAPGGGAQFWFELRRPVGG